MRVKIQDTVDQDEPDNQGWILAQYATPGNWVYHSDWHGMASLPKDTNSADWVYVTSAVLVGSRIADGPPEAWHVRFKIAAQNGASYVNVTYHF
jgi:hypothetical protein